MDSEKTLFPSGKHEYPYKVKLGFTGVYLFFLFLLKTLIVGTRQNCLSEADLKYPKSMLKIKKIPIFSTEKIQFLQHKKNLYIAWACNVFLKSKHSSSWPLFLTVPEVGVNGLCQTKVETL